MATEDPAILTMALESLLIEKGLITSTRIDEIVKNYEDDIGPMKGAQVVARAWVEADYKARLLKGGRKAISEFGFADPHGAELVVTENTDDVHNVVVCTLCSCYPWTVLGLPPVWYKSAPYRSRVVQDPRSVLAEFGTTVADVKEIRVWDSTSEMRYLVIPERPAGTEGWSEDKLRALVTRNSMIGVEEAKLPETIL